MKLSSLEWCAVLAVLFVMAVISLPMLSRFRDSSLRVSCQNNLKQMGIVLRMYANESKDATYPPLSPIYGNWMMDMNTVYPEYLSDLNVLICPASPLASPFDFRLRSTSQHPKAQVGDFHPDCVTGKFYTYTGFLLSGDEPALALYTAYHIAPRRIRRASSLDLPMPRWEQSTWNPNMGGIPVLWERIPQDLALLPHDGPLINVLTMDGAVQAVRYSPLNQSENFPVTELTTWTFGSDVSRLNSDCY